MIKGNKNRTLSNAFTIVIPIGSSRSPNFLNRTAQRAQDAVDPKAAQIPMWLEKEMDVICVMAEHLSHSIQVFYKKIPRQYSSSLFVLLA